MPFGSRPDSGVRARIPYPFRFRIQFFDGYGTETGQFQKRDTGTERVRVNFLKPYKDTERVRINFLKPY